MKKSYVIRIDFHWTDAPSWIIDAECENTSYTEADAWVFSDGGSMFEYVCANYDECDMYLIEIKTMKIIVNQLVAL